MVIQCLKMRKIYFVFWVLLFYRIGTVRSSKISNTESQDTCKDILCISKNFNHSEKLLMINLNFTFANETSNLTDEDIYFVGASEKSLTAAVNKNSFAQKFQDQTATDLEVPVLAVAVKSNLSTNFIEELPNATDLVEVSNSTSYNFSSSTIEPNTTKTIPTSTVKLNIPATLPSFISSHYFLQKNNINTKGICFCDIQVNHCDINCCCDEDCTLSHYKVFTKCIDDNIPFDARYCYKTNFIYGNNSFHKVIQSSGGLFCIVRENAKVGLNYVRKELLTSLEAFNKSLPNNLYAFSNKYSKKKKFMDKNYVLGSPVWCIQKGEFVPLKILYSSVGLLCNSQKNIKYLVDEVEICFYKQQPKTQCKHSRIIDLLQYLQTTKVILNPNFLNKAQTFNFSGTCKANICLGITSYWCESIDSTPHCTKILENSTDFSEMSCSSALSRIQYQIWHNGSEGIVKMEAYLWIKKLSRTPHEFFSQLTTEVMFKWMGSPARIFKRSGNPGYITGKPILAGRKIYSIVNGTADKKEAIELSVDPKDWLSVLGSEKGICSFKKRIPIKFRENSINMCAIKLNKTSFNKENCAELQNSIFKLLIGDDVINETKDNFFNKFIGTFGNSKVEDTGDWVQVLIDVFPIVSSQTSFKSNYYHLTCKNMITDLNIGIVYANIGSFLAPQSKILGVVFQFGKHKDITYNCDSPGCEKATVVQSFKLSSAVHFVDITEPAIDAFAEPLSLEAKLPHDFFYPFFSKSSSTQIFNKIALTLLIFTVFF